MIQKEIFPDLYGIAFLSVDLFAQEIRNRKCRARKFISYFNQHMDQYFNFIEQGILVPFHPVNASEVSIFIETELEEFKLPNGYEKMFQYDGFYLRVGEQGIVTLASFSQLEYSGKDIMNGSTQSCGMTLDQIPYYHAIDFPLAQGEYQFSLIALKKVDERIKTKYDYPFAYAFHFTKPDELIKDNIRRCDDDLFDFRLTTDPTI